MTAPFRTWRLKHGLLLLLMVTGAMASLPRLIGAWADNAWSLAYTRFAMRGEAAVPVVGVPPEGHRRGGLWAARDLALRGQEEQAIALLEAIPPQDTSLALGRLLVGDAFHSSGEIDLAVTQWGESCAVGRLISEGWDAYSRQAWDTAVVAFRSVWECDPETGTLPLALALWTGLKDARGVEWLLREAIENHPNAVDEIEWRLMLGNVLASDERWTEARRVYDDVLAESPSNAMARIALGRALYNIVGLNGAVMEIEAGISLSPSRYEGYEALADVLSQDGMFAQADGWYEKAVALADDDMWLLVRQAYNAWQAGMSARVISSANAVASRYGERLEPRYLAGLYCVAADAYRNEDKGGEAVASVERCLALGSEDATNWVIAGQVYESVYDLPDALSAYERALEIMPSNGEAREAIQRLTD